MLPPAPQAYWIYLDRSGWPDNHSPMKAVNREPEIVMCNGEPAFVIIPIKEWEKLLERAEDAEDIAWLKRARKKKTGYCPLEEYLANAIEN